MAEYYFDIETFTAGVKPDPINDKIITIQYQQLSGTDGSPVADLKILTEWESGSEKAMLDLFKPMFLTERVFDFIPIGVNLVGFDLLALISRLNHHYGLGLGVGYLHDRPHLDLKSTLVMMNHGKFSGYTQLLRKSVSGGKVKEWYLAKDYAKIIDYIKDEASHFITAYTAMKRQLPHLVLDSLPPTLSKSGG